MSERNPWQDEDCQRWAAFSSARKRFTVTTRAPLQKQESPFRPISVVIPGNQYCGLDYIKLISSPRPLLFFMK